MINIKIHKGIKGSVIDKSSNKPIQRATIEVEGIDHAVTTESNGEYWRILAPGDYVIKASHPK